MKPWVICHMVTSIDGRILSSRWPRGGYAELFEKTAASFGIGAWVVGTTTMREFMGRDVALRKSKRRIAKEDYVADRKARRFAIGADAKGALRFQQGEVEGDHTVLLVTKKATSDYLAHLQDAGCSYLFCGDTHVDPKIAMDKIRRVLGVRRLMLEGGGAWNGAVLHAGLVDEISQIVVPVADGGRVTSVFDIPGAPPRKAAAALRLKSHRRMPGGAVWLRYEVA